MPHIDSYYAATQAVSCDFEPLTTHIEADVCVVGGGLAGLTTARELLRLGKSVVLLEGNKVGFGASGRNGGFVSDGYAEDVLNLEKKLGVEHAKALFNISREGTKYVRQNIEGFAADGQDPQYHWLGVVRHDVGDKLEKSVEKLTTVYGADYAYWSTDQVRQHLKSNRYFQALEDRSAFHIHPLNYCVALAKDIQAGGGVIFEETQARALHKHHSHFMIETAHGSVKAGQVVLCGSAYMHDLFPKFEAAVLPVATYVVTTKVMPDKLREAISYKGCISDNRRAGDYYRLIEGGDRLLWGGRITTQKSEPKALSNLLRRDIEAIYPQLSGLEIDKAWSGLMGYCAHKMPILAELEPGIWAATATGGHGLNTTAAIGIVVAEAIAQKSDRYKLFAPFKAQWNGGPFGQVAAQMAYWGMQLQDAWDER
ncbi:NAD(P)/FAD-dependent oxidoreductase [Maritalea porphyrae]|uniref:NAD(P)/FAD-dependent oxidoreductase n=1 Tax=Maritalea porphyrae TaxID=880732 RepID=UPI0022AF47BB|nr:FAD-binding oxidoreductase [Maritalea porphyrae]MCZ4271566.1 FAD-binding oxidoreductase [Maritalea porphyrae]